MNFVAQLHELMVPFVIKSSQGFRYLGICLACGCSTMAIDWPGLKCPECRHARAIFDIGLSPEAQALMPVFRFHWETEGYTQ